MRNKITKRSVDAMQPAPRPVFLWDTEVTGFGCKMTPTGRKSYIFQYRPRTQAAKNRTAPKRVTLGLHGELTPSQARSMAVELNLDVRAGGDPSVAWRPTDSPTVRELAERFLTQHLPTKKKPPRQSTVDGYESIFRKHIMPRIGKRHVDAVSANDVERIHNAMRATPYVANRTLSLLQQAFDQAERWGWRPQHSNPALHIDKYVEARRGSKKEVMLTATQMAKLLEAIDLEEQAGASQVACNAIRVAFWTGWRIGEVLGLRWENVDLDTGVARLLKTKACEEEYRQIPARAVNVIRRLPGFAACPFRLPRPGSRPPHNRQEAVGEDPQTRRTS